MDELTEHRARLQRAHEAFLAVARALGPAVGTRRGRYGAWSARDVVAHRAGWDAEAVARLTLVRAEPGTPNRAYDVDAFNAASVAACEGQGWDATLAELRDTYATLDTPLLSLTPEEAARDGRYAEWALGCASDYEEHTAELRGASDTGGSA
jgi:hypothetical protein